MCYLERERERSRRRRRRNTERAAVTATDRRQRQWTAATCELDWMLQPWQRRLTSLLLSGTVNQQARRLGRRSPAILDVCLAAIDDYNSVVTRYTATAGQLNTASVVSVIPGTCKPRLSANVSFSEKTEIGQAGGHRVRLSSVFIWPTRIFPGRCARAHAHMYISF